MQDFITWLESKNSEIPITEANFLELPQQDGEYVFFGIHLLNRLYNDMGKFPFLSLGPDPERTNVIQNVSKIIEIDPVQRTVIVQPNRTPYSMGYRTIKMDRNGQIRIPSKQLEDVTFLLPKESQSLKLWVVITNNYQRMLANRLRKQELANRREAMANRQQELVPRKVYPNSTAF